MKRGPVSAERHHGVRVHAGLDQVADATAAEVVDDPATRTETGAGLLPELREVPDPPAVALEDVRAVETPGLQSPLEDRGQLALDGEHAGVLVLGVLGAKPDRPLATVIVPPLERPHLDRAPGGPEEEGNSIPQISRELGHPRPRVTRCSCGAASPAGEEPLAHAHA
jgi:hypothetical protein